MCFSSSTLKSIVNNLKTETNMYTCIKMLILALFSVPTRWKQVSITGWMDKQKVSHICKGIIFSYEKKSSSNTCFNMDESWNILVSRKSQTWKAKYCMIPLIWNIVHCPLVPINISSCIYIHIHKQDCFRAFVKKQN